VAVLALILSIAIPRVTRYFQQVFEKYDALNSSVQENVTAIRVVKAFVREDDEIRKFQTASGNVYNLFLRAEKIMNWNAPLMQVLANGCILLISWFGAHFIVAGELSTGSLMSLLTYCMNILMSLMMLSMISVMMTMSAASARRISEVLNEEPSLKNPENPVMEVKDGSIDFEDVDFSYKADATEMVLKDINIHIKSGESIGIIGGTGSAKSSLVNLISRLYDVTRGTLKVGGVDVRDYDMEVLRDQVSVVLQKNVLFSGTIYDNLRWGNPDATDEECREACRMACADEFIDRMPDGYDTYIEQGGANVSGGQKQRLCIARALLKKPRVLILDDSTSACDTATDAKIHHAFDTMIPDTTKLVIAQRVSSVEHCDRILVMENGRVDAFDTPENLLKTNAIYREVYESQTGGNGDFDQ
jgi:ATP-binding cassette subfamily B protein